MRKSKSAPEHEPPPPWRWIGLVLLLVAGILGGLVWWNTPTSEPVTSAVTTPLEPRSPSSSAELERDRSTTSRGVEARGLLVRVVNEADEPVTGARLVIADPGARLLDVATLAVAASSGSDGVAQVSDLTLNSIGAKALMVVHDDYLPGRVVLPPDRASEARVVLRRGYDFQVRCVDVGERPVEGVAIFASLRSVSGEELGEGDRVRGVWRGLDPSDAIYAARTDSEGRARVRNVEQGTYDVRVRSNVYDILERRVAVVVPGNSVEIRLAEILCARVHAVGDEIVSYVAEAGEGLGPEMPTRENVRRVRIEHQSAFPGDLVFLGTNLSDEPPPRMTHLALWMARSGPAHVDVALYPVREGCPETEVPLGEGRALDAEPVSVTFSFVDRVGKVLPMNDIAVALDLQGHKFTVPVRDGETVRLPVGVHQLVTSNPYLKGRFVPDTVRIEPGMNSVGVRIDLELAPCRFALVDRNERSIPNGLLKIRAGGHTRVQQIMEPSTTDIWLPPGIVEVWASAFGYRETFATATLRVWNGVDAQVVPIHLDPN